MPTYQYQCQKCKKEREEFHKMTETPKFKCEECKEPMIRLLGTPAFSLKGKGFHKPGDYQ